MNTYGYVGGNPVSRVDPEGLQITIPWVEPLIRPLPLPSTVDPVLPIPIPIPEPITKGKGRYRCVVRCNVQEITLQAGVEDYRDQDAATCSSGNCPPRVTGIGLGSSPLEAFENAKLAANAGVPRGCYKRHCHGIEGSCKNWK